MFMQTSITSCKRTAPCSTLKLLRDLRAKPLRKRPQLHYASSCDRNETSRLLSPRTTRAKATPEAHARVYRGSRGAGLAGGPTECKDHRRPRFIQASSTKAKIGPGPSHRDGFQAVANK